jgi:hypothetical protein
MIPNSSMTSGCQVPATGVTEQVIVFSSTIVTPVQGAVAKVIFLIARVNPEPMMVSRVLSVKVKLSI